LAGSQCLNTFLTRIVKILEMGMEAHYYNPSYAGGIDRRIMVQGEPWAKLQDPIQKTVKAKKSWGLGLSSNTSTIKKMVRIFKNVDI
jgi:hypothetical protein